MLHVITVRDIKADAFGNPVFSPSTGVAIRSFADEINKGDGNPFAMHPEDYELLHLGTWDPSTAEFQLFDKPKQLQLGSNLKVTR